MYNQKVISFVKKWDGWIVIKHKRIKKKGLEKRNKLKLSKLIFSNLQRNFRPIKQIPRRMHQKGSVHKMFTLFLYPF